MPKKIAPTGKQTSKLIIHAIIFVVANVLIWYLHNGAWKIESAADVTYPWPAWITAAWGLALIGHWAALFTQYEDKYHDEYLSQAKG